MKVAVCAIAKCENPYIREWVDYHIKIGFDHIYIYDNNDANGERCKDVVGNDPKVSVIEKYIGKKQVDCNLQISAYNDFYMRIGHIYDWVIFLDIDEFLVIRDGSGVKEYIADVCGGKGRVEAIQFNWVCYGDSGKMRYSGKPVRERFTKPSLDTESGKYKKLMYRTKLEGFRMENVHYSNVINPIIDCDGNRVKYEKKVKCENPNTNSAYIAHYITKSLEEYILVKKERRGDDTSGKRLSPDFYFSHNERTDEKVELFRKLSGESCETISESVEKAKPKKNVRVCVCAIAKNENLYIREWVEHYRSLSVDEIFLYDNNETDGERFEWVIGDYIDEGFVKVIDVRGIEKGLVYDKNGINLQTKCYIETYESLPDNYGWVCFFDIDEFLRIKDGSNIKDFVTNRRFWGYDTIAVSWEHFDDNGLLQYDPRPLRERFTHVSKIMRYGVKSIARTGKTIFNKKREHNIHVFLLKGKRVCHTDGSSFYISEGKVWQTVSFSQHKKELALLDHYKTKTISEYLSRNNGRHWGTTKACTTVERDFDFWVEDFFKYNEKTDEKMKIAERMRSEIAGSGKGESGKKAEPQKAKPVVMDPHDGISVCVTAYRAQDYIEECLDSIAAQKWFAHNRNWEVIVGIDGCERTLLKVKSIMHKYKNLRVLMMDRNMGTYVTSNTIIKEARYNWVLRFDSDDRMRPNMVTCAMEDKAGNDFVRFGFENFGVENPPKQFGMGWGVVMFNKLVFNKLGGYKEWRCGGDADMIRRFRYNGCTIYEDKRIVFDRRIHPNSLTQDTKTNFDSDLRKQVLSEVKSTDYTILSNRIANFTTGCFTEITADSGICSNITNLASATDVDIERFLYDRAYKSRFKLQIDFRDPKTVQDKLTYIMAYDNCKMLKAKCADKILLHDYSRRVLGKDICVPIINVYDRPEDIDFSRLPNKYVLKCNHGYAMNILCKDNSKMELYTPKGTKLKSYDECVCKLNEWLGTNFGDKYYQWHYALIEPKCYAEVFMDDGHESLLDYKVWCCNGEPKMIMVISDRYTSGLHENIYDTEWNTFDIGWSCARQQFDNLDPKPVQLGKMLEYARALSKDFVFVRVDFYVINDEVYLGELTFSPNGGIFGCRDEETARYWGDMIDISSIL